MIFLNESFREAVEYRTGLLYVTLALLGVLTLSEEVIPLFCRDPQGRLVVSLNTSGVACWLSFWISLRFVTILGIPLSPPAIVTSFGTIERGLECHIALKAHGQ